MSFCTAAIQSGFRVIRAPEREGESQIQRRAYIHAMWASGNFIFNVRLEIEERELHLTRKTLPTLYTMYCVGGAEELSRSLSDNSKRISMISFKLNFSRTIPPLFFYILTEFRTAYIRVLFFFILVRLAGASIFYTHATQDNAYVS